MPLLLLVLAPPTLLLLLRAVEASPRSVRHLTAPLVLAIPAQIVSCTAAEVELEKNSGLGALLIPGVIPLVPLILVGERELRSIAVTLSAFGLLPLAWLAVNLAAGKSSRWFFDRGLSLGPYDTVVLAWLLFSIVLGTILAVSRADQQTSQR